ncbi:signal peptidase I [Acetatifactor muris]|uniref:Signal peptidase I n=1 Tax=Acetatifactor muris TaxID=879566 RepID=A0A2K4ZFP9_9FIRM|nr:signal peptidase I [Acetatifactor muris]MCR2047707.1 signal peptidase I [Acetatifactor muris]SOY29285.1 Signal peptidase I W [Acetatifactor muris]
MSGRKKSPAAAILRAVSILVLLLLLAACLPLTLPRLFGYQIYTVVSGSMEPAIPTGSLVYIREGKPEEAVAGDVIAFYGGAQSGSIITHRVVENRVVMGEIVTKGDANEGPDMNPVPYGHYLGKVEHSIPEAGKTAAVFTSPAGKSLAGCGVGLAVVLQALASFLENRRRRDSNQ